VVAAQVVVVVPTPSAVYQGIPIAVADGKRQLYATDFHGGHIDVFDASFHPVTRQHGDGDGVPFRFEGRLRGLALLGTLTPVAAELVEDNGKAV
jgi:outer membrane protein assembly factor BamB